MLLFYELFTFFLFSTPNLIGFMDMGSIINFHMHIRPYQFYHTTCFFNVFSHVFLSLFYVRLVQLMDKEFPSGNRNRKKHNENIKKNTLCGKLYKVQHFSEER